MAIKPGTPHPTKKGLVMGKNGRYVAKSTYNKQVKAANTSSSKPARQNVTQKTLPAAGESGGSKPPKGTRQPGTTRNAPVNRRSAAASKKAGASMGSKGSGVRVGQPAKSGVGPKVRKGGRIAAGLGVGSYIASKLAEAADPKTWEKKSKELQKRYGSKPSAKPKAKATDKETAALTKPGGLFYRGDGKPKAEKPKPARQNVTPSKPRVKAQTKPPVGKKPAKPQTSGVGPVASGRTYSVQKTGKSVMQQQADELRAMRKASQERQEADKKKKRKYSR